MRMKLSMTALFLGLGLSSVVAAQDLDIKCIVRAGDTVPVSGSTIISVQGVSVNDSGEWIALVNAAASAVVFSEDRELIRSGEPLLGAFVGSIRSYWLSNDGVVTVMVDVNDIGGSTVNRAVLQGPVATFSSGTASVVLAHGDSSIVYAPEQYENIGFAVVGNDFGQFVFSPDHTGSASFVGPVRATVTAGVITAEAQVPPNMFSGDGMVAPTFSAMLERSTALNAAGDVIYSYRFLSLGGVGVNGSSVAREMGTLPAGLGSGTWGEVGVGAQDINDAGDFVIHADVDVGPIEEVLATNIGGAWSRLVTVGQMVAGFGTVDSIGGRAYMIDGGTVLWRGEVDGVQGIYVDTAEALIRQGDVIGCNVSVINFGGLPDRQLVVSSSGRFVGTIVTLLAPGAGSAALVIDREFPSFCSGTQLCSCPCVSDGIVGEGCDIPEAGLAGVRLDVIAQTTSPNGATLSGAGFPSMASPAVIVMRSPGKDASSPVSFGDGLRCVSASGLVRIGATSAINGESVHAIGHGAAAGPGSFYYQLWFRSTPASFCSPEAFNLSGGRILAW